MFWDIFWWLFTSQGETCIKASIIILIFVLFVWGYVEMEKEGD